MSTDAQHVFATNAGFAWANLPPTSHPRPSLRDSRADEANLPARSSLRTNWDHSVAETRPSAASKVAFFILPGFNMLAYAAAIDCLRVANEVQGTDLYQWTNVSLRAGGLSASNGISVHCAGDIRAPDRFDYVFVCASDQAIDFHDAAAFHWLRQQERNGAVMGGISAGAFLLARAGLLRGHRATLHWVYWNAFREEFPEIELRQSLFEIDRNMLTCGGGTAPLDMLHRLFSSRHGAAFADRIGEWFLHTEVRDEKKMQRRSCQARLGVHHAGLVRALSAMEDSLEEPLSRTELASVAGVSERQLDRLFLSQVGRAVNAYYLELRLERAQHLVLHSTLSQLEITYACGFRSQSSFSKAYRAVYGLPPSRDRATMSRKRGAVSAL